MQGSAMLNFKISNIYRTAKINEASYLFSAKDNFSILAWFNKQYQNKLKFWLSYRFQNEDITNYELLPASYIQSNFSFQNNLIKNQLPSGHQFSVRISRNNTYKLTNFYLGSNIGFRQQRWLSDFVFYNSIVSSKPYFISNNNNLRVYGMWEKFLPKAKTNLVIKPSIRKSQGNQIVEGKSIGTNSSQIAIQLKLGWRVHRTTLLSLDSQFGKRFFKTKNQPSAQFNDMRLNPFLSK